MSKIEVRTPSRNGCQYRALTKPYSFHFHKLSQFSFPIPCEAARTCPFCNDVGSLMLSYVFGAIDRADNKYVIYKIDNHTQSRIVKTKQSLFGHARYDTYDVLLSPRPNSAQLNPLILPGNLTLDEQEIRANVSIVEIQNVVKSAPQSCLNTLHKRYLDIVSGGKSSSHSVLLNEVSRFKARF